MKRISSGVPALDDLLQGGFPEGATVLVAGRPGTGKTILAHQMMFVNASAESKCVYFTTLAEPQVKVLRFQQEFEFFDLAKFQKSVIYHDLGSVLRRQGYPQALAAVDSVLREHQPKVVVIDTIKTISEMIPSLTEYREFILDLSLKLATWGVTSLLLGEYSEADIDIRPESAIADGILYLSGTEEKKRQRRFLRVLKMRGTAFQGGENFFRISCEGIGVYPRLVPEYAAQAYRQFSTRDSTGIPELDRMVGGGYPAGTVTLVSGSPGTGKTLFALQFIRAGLQAGEACVLVSFEESPEQITHCCRSFGFDVEPYVSAGKLRVLHVSPAELDVDEHLYAIQELVKRSGAKRLVIDSISSFEIGMPDKVKYTDYILALTDYLKMQGTSTVLTCETHDSGGLPDYARNSVSFVADNIVLLRHRETGPTLSRSVRVVKMRASGHDDCVREFEITGGGVAIKSTQP